MNPRHATAGMGRKTRQFNPAVDRTQNLGEGLNAVLSPRGEGGTMNVADAVAVFLATPPENRTRFAREI